MKTHRVHRMLPGLLSVSILAIMPVRAAGRTNDTEHPRLMAIAWMRAAAEVRALQYQAFNIAHRVLDRDLADPDVDQPRAIIVDIDETVLNTSEFQAELMLGKRKFPTGWTEWLNAAEATAIPGALEFLRYAHEKKVAVFYVTNRHRDQSVGTLRNLKKLGFPCSDPAHLLCKTDSSSKQSRREHAASTHHIVCLIGDNLNDFDAAFEPRRHLERERAVDQRHTEFGHRFIILPNPMYGHWEGALYNGDRTLSPEQRRQRLLDILTGSVEPTSSD